jgi:hypothetical protein
MRMSLRFRIVAFAFFTMASSSSLSASECSARSGSSTAALIELYTSEGCDSCPPADRWLSTFAARPRPGIVPIAFHVDYWDYLGWKDRFADPRYAERQRSTARAAGARAVYTPQVMVAGRVFHEWRTPGRLEEALAAVSARAARASIEAEAVATDRGVTASLNVEAANGQPTRDLAVVSVLTESGLSSRVTAGENRGANLAHDFVARGWHAAREWRGKRLATKARFDLPPSADRSRLRVAVFVQDTRSGEVLQALALPLC